MLRDTNVLSSLSILLAFLSTSGTTPDITPRSIGADTELVWQIAQGASSLKNELLGKDPQGKDQQSAVIVQRRTVLKLQRGVAELAFSKDGEMLATGAASKSTTTLWHTSTGQLIADLTGEHDSFLDNTVSRLHFSPDGLSLETGSSGKKVRLWEVRTGQLKVVLIGFGDFLSVAFSPDGRTIAMTSSEDRRIPLYDVASGRLIKTLLVPERPVCDICLRSSGAGHLAFSPDGRTLATSVQQRAQLWDISTEKIRAELIGHNSTVYAIAFSPDGKTVATISHDTTARLWDGATGQLKATLRGHKAKVRRMAFSPDGKTLATGGEDETARLWDVETGALKATLSGHKDGVWSVSFSFDSRLIATGGEKTAKLWDARTGELKQTLEGMRAPTAFSPVAGVLATAGKDGTVVLWEVSYVK